MTLDVETRAITAADLLRLSMVQDLGIFRLREGDTKECLAIGLTPAEAITSCVGNSVASFIVTVNGELVATWGYVVKNPLSGIGYPWLLTTPEIEKYKMFFARTSCHTRDFLLTRFNRLEVLVAADYLRAQAWLEWLGFSTPGAAFKVNETQFVYMFLERK